MSLEESDRKEVIHALKGIVMELEHSLYLKVEHGRHDYDWDDLADIFMEHFEL